MGIIDELVFAQFPKVLGENKLKESSKYDLPQQEAAPFVSLEIGLLLLLEV